MGLNITGKLTPTSTLGDIIYHNGTNDTRLPGNNVAAKYYLTQTGNGTSSAAPQWNELVLPSGLTAGATSAGFLNYNGTTATAGQLDGGSTAPTATTRLNYGGYFYATRVYNAYYNDYAEYFEKDEACEPGDVLMKNPNGHGYIKSISAYNKGVVGVYSDQYAHCIGGDGQENVDDRYAAVGLAGRVNVKVKGNIEVGDMLVSSEVPGVAMKASEFVMGTVIGKALENYSSQNIGLIEMLIVNL